MSLRGCGGISTKLCLSNRPRQDFLRWIFSSGATRHGIFVRRVHFNLAENRKDEDWPFAFLATYTMGLSAFSK